jgi:hypothetical protein
MFVRFVVLIALALSLGDLHDETDVVDHISQVSLLEHEPEIADPTFSVETSITRAVPRRAYALAEIFLLPPLSFDAGRIERPPRVLVA